MPKNAVLITTYPEAFLQKGGGEYELMDVALYLRKLGLNVDIYSPFSQDIEYYNAIIHFSVHPSGLPLFRRLKQSQKKLILWPNFWIQKKSSVDVDILKEFVQLADIVVFKSNIEKELFEKITPIPISKICIAPAGVDPVFAEKTPENLFKTSFGITEYILWVGIIEEQKNQLNVIRALQNQQLPLVLVGNCRNKDYYEACKSAAPKHFVFLDPIEHASDIYRAALQECSLYIEPTLEPAGKSALEAAVSGANILLSDAPWEREHFKDFATYVNPKSPDSISAGIKQSLQKEVSDEQVKYFSNAHLMQHTLKTIIYHIKN